MATQEKNQNFAMLSLDEALMEFDCEVDRLERDRQALEDFCKSGKSVLGYKFVN